MWVPRNPGVWVQSNLMLIPSIGQNIVDLGGIILEKIWMVLEIQFALKKESMKHVEVGTVKWVRFSELDLAWHDGFDYGVNCLDKCFFGSWRLGRGLVGSVVGIWPGSLAWVQD